MNFEHTYFSCDKNLSKGLQLVKGLKGLPYNFPYACSHLELLGKFLKLNSFYAFQNFGYSLSDSTK